MLYTSNELNSAHLDAQMNKHGVSLDTLVCRDVYRDDVSAGELHLHRGVEISVVVEGCGIQRIMGRSIPCQSGDIYILNANTPHRYFVSEGGSTLTVRRILFDPKRWLEGELANNGGARFCHGVFTEHSMIAYAMLTQQTLERILALFDTVAIEMIERKSEWRDAVRSYLSLILITFSRYANRSIKVGASENPSDWNYLSRMISAAHEHYVDPSLTLESIGTELYVSKSRLSRLFRRIMREGFSEYLRHVRISMACELLKSTDLSVVDVMQQCGMRDPNTFYRAFGEQIGMTPKQYRKQNRKGETYMNILSEISEKLQIGKAKLVKELVQQAIDEGIEAETILTEGLLSGMNVIGEKFKNNQVYVPEVLVAARAMNMGAQLLKPLLAVEGVAAKGKVCIGTVQGDLHDIGKNLVKMMMEGKGLEVIDLGTDVSPATFVQTAIDEDCRIICCSALLTTTMGVMADVVKAAEAAGIRDKVKIMVGGAPITEEFCRAIGADCYSPDAATAAEAAVAFCKV